MIDCFVRNWKDKIGNTIFTAKTVGNVSVYEFSAYSSEYEKIVPALLFAIVPGDFIFEWLTEVY